MSFAVFWYQPVCLNLQNLRPLVNASRVEQAMGLKHV
jgi:hypothetical protein